MMNSNLNSLLPCIMPGAPYGLEAAQEACNSGLVCSSEFALGCLVPFEVEVPVPAGGTVRHEVKPNCRLLPVAMVRVPVWPRHSDRGDHPPRRS